MAFSHLYPWQLYSRLKGVMLTCKLEGRYDVATMRQELEAVMSHFTSIEQHGHYHDGGWKSVALHAIDGNPEYDRPKADGVYKKTPALAHAPMIEQLIDSFDCEKKRIRLLQLFPKENIYWHFDQTQSIDSNIVRLHVPIVTNDQVHFQICHEDCRWQPGELFYGDFTFPHRVYNGSDSVRVHLVLDLVTNDNLRALFPEVIFHQTELRARAREQCRSLMWRWGKLFPQNLKQKKAGAAKSVGVA